MTSAALVLRADGTFLVDVTADLDALLLGAGSGHDSAELAARVAALPEVERAERVERLGALFQRRVRLRFDGIPVDLGVTYPDRRPDPGAGDGTAPASWLGLRARLGGRAPADWREVTFWASRAFQAVRFTVVELETGRSASHDLEAGAESPPFARQPGSPD